MSKSPEEEHLRKAFGWAARDSSGVLSPFKFSCRWEPCSESAPVWEPESKVIKVEVLDKGPMTIDNVRHDWTIKKICKHIKHKQKEKIQWNPRSVYVLTHDGNVLENSKTLSDYSIDNWATLNYEEREDAHSNDRFSKMFRFLGLKKWYPKCMTR